MDKLEYLSRMLNRRTNGKNYENMIVNAIYNGVNNPNLIPVTQQYVRVSRDKYHLLDLYFPQLNYGVEVDESQHEKEENKILDIERSEDIYNTIECQEGRIKIYDEKGLRSYDDVYRDVQNEIDIIKKKIAEVQPIKWVTNSEKKKIVLEKREFTADDFDDVEYDSVTEIYNAVTNNNVEKLSSCYMKLHEGYYLWVPKLYLGKGYAKELKSRWKHILSDDKNIITEYEKKSRRRGRAERYSENHKRVVFMRMKNKFGGRCIRFVGVYKAKERKFTSANTCITTYQKVDNSFKF